MSDREDGEVIHEVKQPKTQQTKQKFQMKSSSYRTRVCEHYKKGACKNGDKCSFQHPKEMQNVIRICKFYLGGSCSNQLCGYSHDLSKYQCKFFFAGGNCKEANCRFSHDPWENEISKQFWVNDNEQFIKEQFARRQTTGLGLDYDEQFKKKQIECIQQNQHNPQYSMQRVQPQFMNQYNLPQFTPQVMTPFTPINHLLQQLLPPPQTQVISQNRLRQQQDEQFEKLKIHLPEGVELISDDEDKESIKSIISQKSLKSSKSSLEQLPLNDLPQNQFSSEVKKITKQKWRRTYRKKSAKKIDSVSQQTMPIRQHIVKYFFGI